MSQSDPPIASSTEVVERRMVAHDLWPRRFLERRNGETPTLPAEVFWPTSIEEVKTLVKRARTLGVPLVPFGAGSGVCAGISPTERAWVLDTKRLNRIISVDKERGLCTVEAGMIGERFERELNTHGFSLGHFPSSIYCSTVGGWVAARSAGQLSSRYGKIEDLLFGLRGVDGTGTEIEARLDDPATGPAALRLLTGAEGALFVITHVTFRIHPIASHRWMRGFVFEDLKSALPAVHSLLTRGIAPSVVRVYDPIDTWISGAQLTSAPDPDRLQAGGIAQAGLEHSGPKSDDEPNLFDAIAEKVEELALFQHPGATRRVVGTALAHPLLLNTLASKLDLPTKAIIGIEGDPDDVAERAKAIHQTLVASGAKDAGSGPGMKWLLHRHRFSYKMSRVFAVGGWADTMEVATGWDNVLPLYHAVKEALRDVALVMCHFSHAYVDGCSLYFVMTGGGSGKGRRSAIKRYDLAWERALMAVRKHGGTISHHHGVGRSKVEVLERAPFEIETFRKVQKELDPDRILNPGVLGFAP